jgi:hypothetical protein
MGKKRQQRPEKHKQDLGAQLVNPNSYGVRVSITIKYISQILIQNRAATAPAAAAAAYMLSITSCSGCDGHYCQVVPISITLCHVYRQNLVPESVKSNEMKTMWKG